MCRNIRTLHNFEPPATEEEVRAAALQYVRKISGSTRPSQANAGGLRARRRRGDRRVRAPARRVATQAPPKDREAEAAKARARAAKRFAA